LINSGNPILRIPLISVDQPRIVIATLQSATQRLCKTTVANPINTKKVKPGTRVCSDTWRAYTGLAAKGYVHRTVEHRKKEYAKGKNHINDLEGFWGYLKRKLAAKGGVRRKYLSLFLSEYVWRYNKCQLAPPMGRIPKNRLDYLPWISWIYNEASATIANHRI